MILSGNRLKGWVGASLELVSKYRIEHSDETFYHVMEVELSKQDMGIGNVCGKMRRYC